MRSLFWLCVGGWFAMVPTDAFAQAAASQAAPPAQAAPAPAAEASRSLFEPTWRQFQIGGRLSSIDGDPARWQRYEDLRDGVIFTNARYAREWEGTGQLFRATADNLGYRDQRYSGVFERPGRFKVTGLWDEIPQFYSVDTRTAFTSGGEGVLVLPDSTQSAIQSGQANLNAYVPISPQFELHERRDIGLVTLSATPRTGLDLTSTFRTQRHVGELPWGASFGFSNDVEVALPYNSRANDFSVGAEWTNQTSMLRVAYDGSWFDNHDGTLVWDSPLRLTDGVELPGKGRTALWPSNTAQTISFGGYRKLARNTQLTGFVSFGAWSNDEPLLPFTINTALPTFPLPRGTAQAEASVFSDQPQPRVPPRHRLAGERRASGSTATTTRRRTPSIHAIHQLRHVEVGTSTTGGPETVCPQPDHLLG